MFGTPLEEAVTMRSPAVVRALLECGAYPNLHLSHDPPLLAKALGKKSADWAVALIEGGADVNAVDEHGRPPLCFAIDQPSLITLLTTHGARVNFVTKDGNGPLHYAVLARWNVDASIHLLVSLGADVDFQRPSDGRTALHRALMNSNASPRAVAALLACGACPLIPDCTGRTPLDIARSKSANLAQLMLNGEWKLRKLA